MDGYLTWTESETGRVWIERRLSECEAEILAKVEPEYAHEAPLLAAAPVLFQALRDALESLSRLPDVEGAYRVTCMKQAEMALALAGVK